MRDCTRFVHYFSSDRICKCGEAERRDPDAIITEQEDADLEAELRRDGGQAYEDERMTADDMRAEPDWRL